MKKNIDIIIFSLLVLVVVAWAGFSFAERNTSLAELETNINEQTTENSFEEEKEKQFASYHTDNTNPEKFGLKTEIYSGSTKIDSYSVYDFDFGLTNEYTLQKGIVTFRGNNFRDNAVYGDFLLNDKIFDSAVWQITTGALSSGSKYDTWSGSGWTGQPLIVEWDDETKNLMNIYPEKKAKENLVEVIYATMAGKIYFVDLDDGTFTRDTLDLGFTFKGAGALDPRGYPLMYVGAGDYNPSGTAPKMFIISLIDGKVLKEYNGNDSLAHRPGWGAFDSSAIVCAETDTLIYPGENGLIYLIKLNSIYDKQNGTIAINPDEPVKLKVTTNRSNTTNFWYGFETSPVCYGKYMYIADNGGYLYCIDLTSLNVVWMQDVIDDTNCSPVLEVEEDGNAYIYISTSLHWTQKNSRGDIPVFKIDAQNGEIVWEHKFNCATVDGTSGGVQGTIALGKDDCSSLIFVPVAHYPERYDGGIMALDKATGQEVWYHALNGYTWSSPVVIKSADGKSVVLACDVAGDITMLDAQSGVLVSRVSGGGLIEASPVVYNDMIVIGLRNKLIKGIRLK